MGVGSLEIGILPPDKGKKVLWKHCDLLH